MVTREPAGLSDERESELLQLFLVPKPEDQNRFFKSHAYVCRLAEDNNPNQKNRIVAGFRGTWLHSSAGESFIKEVPKRSISSNILSKLSNFAFDTIGPSNYGLADLYYDATLIHVPFRKGVVWKWYTYWGSLVLGGSNRIQGIFGGPRRVAAGLISRPVGDAVGDHRDGLVHLGFWSLWASPEGFAGYDRAGHLWEDQKVEGMTEPPLYERKRVREGILQSVLKMIQEGDQSRETEILVVGHSLGGAISCFAALDLAAELEKSKGKLPKVSIFHATFGAPPVGTRRFAKYFDDQMVDHESWAVYHEKDIVARCFAKASTLFLVKKLGWWTDWSHAGTERRIRKLWQGPPDAPEPKNGSRLRRIIDGAKMCLVGVGAITFLGFSCLTTPLSVIVAPICWIMDRKYYVKQKNPEKTWKKDAGYEDDGAVQEEDTDPTLHDVNLDYHSLEKYIKFLEKDDPFGNP